MTANLAFAALVVLSQGRLFAGSGKPGCPELALQPGKLDGPSVVSSLVRADDGVRTAFLEPRLDNHATACAAQALRNYGDLLLSGRQQALPDQGGNWKSAMRRVKTYLSLMISLKDRKEPADRRKDVIRQDVAELAKGYAAAADQAPFLLAAYLAWGGFPEAKPPVGHGQASGPDAATKLTPEVGKKIQDRMRAEAAKLGSSKPESGPADGKAGHEVWRPSRTGFHRPDGAAVSLVAPGLTRVRAGGKEALALDTAGFGRLDGEGRMSLALEYASVIGRSDKGGAWSGIRLPLAGFLFDYCGRGDSLWIEGGLLRLMHGGKPVVWAEIGDSSTIAWGADGGRRGFGKALIVSRADPPLRLVEYLRDGSRLKFEERGSRESPNAVLRLVLGDKQTDKVSLVLQRRRKGGDWGPGVVSEELSVLSSRMPDSYFHNLGQAMGESPLGKPLAVAGDWSKKAYQGTLGSIQYEIGKGGISPEHELAGLGGMGLALNWDMETWKGSAGLGALNAKQKAYLEELARADLRKDFKARGWIRERFASPNLYDTLVGMTRDEDLVRAWATYVAPGGGGNILGLASDEAKDPYVRSLYGAASLGMHLGEAQAESLLLMGLLGGLGKAGRIGIAPGASRFAKLTGRSFTYAQQGASYVFTANMLSQIPPDMIDAAVAALESGDSQEARAKLASCLNSLIMLGIAAKAPGGPGRKPTPRQAAEWAERLRDHPDIPAELRNPAQIAKDNRNFANLQERIRQEYKDIMAGRKEPPAGISRERLRLAYEGDHQAGGRVPLSFKDARQFHAFQAELRALLREAGITDATIQQVGSATKGFKGNPKKYEFHPDGTLKGGLKPWSLSSDMDLGVFSGQALVQAMERGVKPNVKSGIVNGRASIFKNEAPGGAGFYDTPLGSRLRGFAQRWNRVLYPNGWMKPGFDGIDFKLQLSPEPFRGAVTVVSPR